MPTVNSRNEEHVNGDIYCGVQQNSWTSTDGDSFRVVAEQTEEQVRDRGRLLTRIICVLCDRLEHFREPW